MEKIRINQIFLYVSNINIVLLVFFLYLTISLAGQVNVDSLKTNWVDPKKREIYNIKLQKNGLVKNYQLYAKKTNVEMISLQLNSRLIVNESGNPVRSEGTFIDITEKRKIEEKIKEKMQGL